MTRNEFEDAMCCFADLLEFCEEFGCYVMEDVIDDDTLDEYINDTIASTYDDWRSIRDNLNDIPTGYDYYLWNGYEDVSGVDGDDFEYYYSEIFDWCEHEGIFDEDEDENGAEYTGVPQTTEYRERSAPATPTIEEPEDEDFEAPEVATSELIRACRQEVSERRLHSVKLAEENDDDLPWFSIA